MTTDIAENAESAESLLYEVLCRMSSASSAISALTVVVEQR